MSKICYLVPEDKLEEMLYDVRMVDALRAANMINEEFLGTVIQYMKGPTSEWFKKEKEQFYALNLYGGRD